MKSENMLCEEWKGYRPNMPVQVVGVKNGKITGNGSGVEIFKNLKDAQRRYADLDPEKNSMRFTWVTKGSVKGKDAGRFETWRAYKMYSMEEQIFQDVMKEAKFNASILPANLEDLEMKTLIVAIGSTVTGLLDKVKKNTRGYKACRECNKLTRKRTISPTDKTDSCKKCSEIKRKIQKAGNKKKK